VNLIIALVVIAVAAIVGDRILAAYAKDRASLAPGEPDPVAAHHESSSHR